jgi:heat shock protein HslJ
MIRVRRALLAAGVVVTTALLTTGCPRPPDPKFEGTTWVLLNGTSGAPPLVPGEPPIRPNMGITAVFQQLSTGPQAGVGAGRVTGSTGCNTYSGSYRRNGSELTIDSLTWTEIGCAPDIMAREAAYLTLLPQVASLKITGLLLELSAGDGTKLLTFGGMPTPVPTSSTTTRPFTLAGTYGVLRYLRDTTLTSTSGSGDQVIVSMQPDGRLLGQACNHFEGTWSSSGDTIRFEAAFTTEMACATPVAQDLEQWFLPALTSATHWQKVSGGPLTLTRADGTTVVSALLLL